jgi:hypothetical protein
MARSEIKIGTALAALCGALCLAAPVALAQTPPDSFGWWLNSGCGNR